VQYTSKPVSGLAMAERCASVIRGGNKPLVVLETSNAAEAAGVVVPIPICAFTKLITTNRNPVRIFGMSKK
jgi:hypothetical protein